MHVILDKDPHFLGFYFILTWKMDKWSKWIFYNTAKKIVPTKLESLIVIGMLHNIHNFAGLDHACQNMVQNMARTYDD